MTVGAALPRPHLPYAQTKGCVVDFRFRQDSFDWCKGVLIFCSLFTSPGEPFAFDSMARTIANTIIYFLPHRLEKRFIRHSTPSTRCCANSGNRDLVDCKAVLRLCLPCPFIYFITSPDCKGHTACRQRRSLNTLVIGCCVRGEAHQKKLILLPRVMAGEQT